MDSGDEDTSEKKRKVTQRAYRDREMAEDIAGDMCRKRCCLSTAMQGQLKLESAV